MFGSFMAKFGGGGGRTRSKNTSFGQQNTTDSSNIASMNSPSVPSNFGSSFGRAGSNPMNSYAPSYGGSFNHNFNQSPQQNPTFTPPANMSTPNPMQSQVNPMQSRAMMPSGGINSFWNPQASGMGSMLRNEQTGQSVDLSQNQNQYGDLFSRQFRDRLIF